MISIAKFREALALPAARDAETQRLLASVVSMWELHTNRLWSKRTGYVQRWEGVASTTGLSFLKCYPILRSPITEGGSGEILFSLQEQADDDAAPVAVVATDYRLDTSMGQFRRLRTNPWRSSLIATYTAGYEDDTAPGDVIEVLFLQAKYWLKRNSPDKVDLASQAFEKGSTTYLTGLLHPAFKELARFRRKLV